MSKSISVAAELHVVEPLLWFSAPMEPSVPPLSECLFSSMDRPLFSPSKTLSPAPSFRNLTLWDKAVHSAFWLALESRSRPWLAEMDLLVFEALSIVSEVPGGRGRSVDIKRCETPLVLRSPSCSLGWHASSPLRRYYELLYELCCEIAKFLMSRRY